MREKKKSDKAVRMAVQSLRDERQKLAFDANLFDLRLACYPKAKSASERRKQIDAAIAELTGQSEPVSRIIAQKGRQLLPPASGPEQMEMFRE